ncbi:ribonuclease HII [Salirhabdus salicampi]|uniref:ribonuclease HII n=1 Tax=Salirhabdus salicampi TaxID=476102 RepID=UPI0020C59C94|nr:ribonuclease HII [Salirhabdus salicampi]MCP8616539.1 ribonuclease HII [Salirhabdus salicampi]
MKETKTITQIKQQLEQGYFTEEEWQQFKHDERKGVQALIHKFEKKLAEKKALQEKFERMLAYEKQEWANGMQYTAGIDEVGRGPLAGPVVAAAVVLPQNFYLEGLDDSKKLSKEKRETYYTYIKENAVTYGIGIANNQQIDDINIYQATIFAMKEAIGQLSPKPDSLLIDAVPLRDVAIPQQSLTKGDQKSVSIAAASILAKVTRDRFMEEIHKEFPSYHFNSNVGYGTKDHITALQQYGPSPYHRFSFAPVQQALMKK